MPDSFLPYGRQTIDEADIAAVGQVLRSAYLTTGPAVAEFEASFANATGAKHAIACSSGTAALHLAALALGLGPDQTVVVPSVTFLATVNAARFAGAEVCFADVGPETGLMTPATLHEAIERAEGAGKRPVRAVFPVHLNGQKCELEALAEYNNRGIAVVEDACHALGGDGVGNCQHSDMATFSLHPVKIITAGEGGVVTTNDDALAAALFRSRNHGIVREPDDFLEAEQAFDASGVANPWYYEMPELGFNYRLSDIHAALARSQLRKLDALVARRQHLAARYDRLLRDLKPVVRPVRRIAGPTPALHLYVVLIDFEVAGKSRARVMADLREAGIGTQVHYLPVHRQPYYRARYGSLDLPGADAYYARALSLPFFPAMSDTDVDRVVDALGSVIGAVS